MRDVLIVVDMQNDFVDGALGTKEAVAITPSVIEKVRNFNGTVLFTADTHSEEYLSTQEGRNLPVKHCVKGTEGWKIRKELEELRKTPIIEKVTFGSSELGPLLVKMNSEEEISSITLVGLCTDICVISNAMIVKAFLPEVKVCVDSKCCAGVTPATHDNALEAMKMCQIEVL